MNIRDVYEKVLRKIQISQPEFFSYLNDTVGELVDLYGEKLTLNQSARIEADNLDDSLCVNEAYAEAIVDNIIALAGVTEDAGARKSEFVRKSKNAYNRLWSKIARKASLTNYRRWL